MFNHSRRLAALTVGMLAGFLLTIALTVGAGRYSAAKTAVCRDTLRLHILANSDSAADQALKLQVRDALLGEMDGLLDGAEDKQAAIRRLQGAMPRLELTVRRTLRAWNSGQEAVLHLEQLDFDARAYDGFDLPGGEYTALRVELGAAAGHNWFCVLYPALCVGSAEGRYEEPGENALVFGKYEIRSAFLDTVRSWLPEAAATPETAPAAPSR